MSTAEDGMKREKREREEDADVEEHAQEADASTVKRVKADKMEEKKDGQQDRPIINNNNNGDKMEEGEGGDGEGSKIQEGEGEGNDKMEEGGKIVEEEKKNDEKEDMEKDLGEVGDGNRGKENKTENEGSKDEVSTKMEAIQEETTQKEEEEVTIISAASKKNEVDEVDASAKKDNAEATCGKKDEVVEESLTKEEAEAEVLKMLEFYFGDSNYGWDRFMQSKAGKMGEGLMDISVLLTFNKLKTIVKKAGLDQDAAEAMVARAAESSEKLRLSEDKAQIGRVTPMTEEGTSERMGRTVQTKGYKKDAKMKIEDVEKLFEETGKAVYVKICRAGRSKLTSIFVEFETKEAAHLACERSDQYSYDGDTITVRKASRDKEGDDKKSDANAEAEEPKGPSYEPGKILHVTGIPESGVSRESLREAMNPYGKVLYVEFSFGNNEAWLRMENASEATAAVEGTKEEGVTLAAEVEDKGALVILQGDTEKEYYDRLEKARAERTGRNNGFRSRGRGRGRGRGRRGRGGGRGN